MLSDCKVSIVTVNYNSLEYLVRCLNSIQKHLENSIRYEVIIVDNHSNDGSQEFIREHYPQFTLLANKSNLGYSAGNNQGMELAHGRFIFLLNPDTELTDASLADMVKWLENPSPNSHPVNQCIAGPVLLNGDGSWQNSMIAFPTVWNIVCKSLFLSPGMNKLYTRLTIPEIICRAEVLSGAALLFPAELISKTGGFDNNLFWMDDVDFCYRNHISGGTNIIFPGCRVIHHGGKSALNNYNVVISNQLISKLKYFRKHGTSLQYPVVVFFILFQIVNRIAFFTLLYVFSQEYRMKWKGYVFALKSLKKYLSGRDAIIT